MYHISVVIPTYNREKYIKKSVESVLAQEGQGEGYEITEVIVVDDGSSDNTQKIVEDLKDKHIRLHRMEHNSGAAVARNAGVKLANGEWIAFQDSDDVWHKDKLKKQTEYLASHPETDMVSHPIKARFDDGSEVTTEYVDADDMVPYLAQRNYYDTPTILVRKDCFLDVGGFDQELKALEDWEFALRFANRYRIGMVSDVLIDSEMITGGVSSKAAAYYESRCRMISGDRTILMAHNCFDDAVRSLLLHAQRNDVLDMVARILELELNAL